MRITIDLPDALLHQVEATAAMKGLTVAELIASYAVECLRQANESRPRRAPPVIAKAAIGKLILALSADALRAIEVEQDVSEFERLTGRSS